MRKVDPEKGLGVRSYAAHRKKQGLPGGTTHSVEVALKSGRITRNKNGLLDPEQADRDWQANTDHRKRPRHSEPGGEKPAPKAAIGKALTLAEARALNENIKAREREVAFLERTGKLVDAAEVEREAFTAARELRDRILLVPSRIASEVLAAAEEGGARAVEALLVAALREALQEQVSDGRSRTRKRA